MQDQVLGSPMPVLSISLEPGESVLAEAGEFAWMTDSIQLSTGVSGAGAPLRLQHVFGAGRSGDHRVRGPAPGQHPARLCRPGHLKVLVHRHGFLAWTTGG